MESPDRNAQVGIELATFLWWGNSASIYFCLLMSCHDVKFYTTSPHIWTPRISWAATLFCSVKPFFGFHCVTVRQRFLGWFISLQLIPNQRHPHEVRAVATEEGTCRKADLQPSELLKRLSIWNTTAMHIFNHSRPLMQRQNNNKGSSLFQ